LNSFLAELIESIEEYEKAFDIKVIEKGDINCPEIDFLLFCDGKQDSQTKLWHDFSLIWRSWYRDLMLLAPDLLENDDSNSYDHKGTLVIKFQILLVWPYMYNQ